MDVLVWRDGRILPGEDPDPGLLSGLGVFETILIDRGKPFALGRHLGRLAAGAARMGLPEPLVPQVHEALAAVLPACESLEYARLRLTWTPGGDGLGSLLVTVAPYVAPRGVRAVISAYRRNERSAIVGIKATSYAENLLALAGAKRAGADEAILADSRGMLSEGAMSNIFVEFDGEIFTPSLDSGCLPGITRGLCLEWGRAAGLPIVERDLHLDVMKTTAHAAVTSALKGVVPITEIGGRSLKIGPLTRELIEVFTANRRNFPNP